MLAKYVRDEGVLTLEEAVHKMTGLPAAWLSQSDRGLLREGLLADIVVFDEQTIQDYSEYTDPHHYSEGIVHLLVNGTPVLSAGVVTGATPARFWSAGRRRQAGDPRTRRRYPVLATTTQDPSSHH